ncbi:ParB/RepB/Spo0J family partition protein [Collinsella sp. AGMB00827]|uniref:ParB/RepB/Spo0J family partition protein n=1 Tax=Collinsella ureilytica TaxID=2869515 RepID=A0ABS7MKB3_9ACTN|nr:ParB/RepB/Spo0J family partition protein [Collinsella urealyticum]MBY4797809.1 ParB/RepB/Spo0J family partition protein [Collinsella urealyticum]
MGEAQSETGFTSESGPVSVPLGSINPNPNQPRTHFNEDELQELADSIQAHGVLQPLLVRKKGKKYEIIAGERRYQASCKLGLDELPVIIKDVDDQTMLEIALIENLQRSDLNPIEEARGYRQLIKQSGMTQEALSQAVSKSRSTITNSLRLLDLPQAVQDYLFAGSLTAGHARAILAVPFDEQRVKLADKVVTEGLSVRATENLAPLFSVGNQQKAGRPPTPQSFKKASRVLRKLFDTNVRVKTLRGKHKIEIEFKDEDDLTRIMETMVGASSEEV